MSGIAAILSTHHIDRLHRVGYSLLKTLPPFKSARLKRAARFGRRIYRFRATAAHLTILALTRVS